MMEFAHTDLLDLRTLSTDEIALILETAKSFKEVSTRDIKKVPALRGKTVVMLFFEPSTRTRISFELAAKRLSADTLNITVSASSLSKGESVLDMAKNIEAMNVDMVVVRHQSAGVPHLLARALKPGIINAGDGCRAHPTQALLDLFTIKEKCGTIKGLNVAIIGDVLHSRVARSNICGLIKMGARVTICAPSTLVPPCIEDEGVEVTHRLDDVLKESDVLMFLRLQKERQNEKYLPSIREYTQAFGLNAQKFKLAKKEVVIMHPGPVNRGIELSADVADGPNSVILDQVNNGVAVRMAILYLLSGKKDQLVSDKKN
jgi:aspartate carbamoyltransferase catalytic subunit